MSSQSVRRIFFLSPYPFGSAPGQRFRYEQYVQLLTDNNFKLDFFSFLDPRTNEILYKKGHFIRRFSGLIYGFLKRFALLSVIHKADYVFIFREAAPIGPPVFEWIIAKIFRKKIIYDFDDAIWTTDKPQEGAWERLIRWRWKVRSICTWSYKVSCGNEYLCNYARSFNKNVVLNPTTIDTNYHRYTTSFKKNENEIVVGWTGSHSTLKYLDEIVPVIQYLEKRYPSLVFLVIANQKPTLSITSLRFIQWSKETEIEDLAKIDIGIMPLPNDEWSKGKCGFKLLQYMSLKKPSIASPVGVNTTIIDNGVDGLISDSADQWVEAIEKLINDVNLRTRLGEAGRRKVELHYSVSSNTSNFLLLFQSSAINTSATR